MIYAVRYHSRTGNTKKLAEAIASVLNVEALDLSTPISEDKVALFLGSAIYAAGVDDEVKRFLKENKDKIEIIYNFSTTALLTSTYKQISKIANENNIAISEKEFHCRGRFKFIHKSRPDEEDIKNVQEFVNDILKGENK